METDASDYVYSSALIGLVLAATVSVLWVAQRWLEAIPGPYLSIALVLLFALLYGGFTALVLAAVSAWLPLREGDYTMDHPQFTLWKVHQVVAELGKAALSLFFPVFIRPAFYALFGARVGSRVAVGGKIVDPRLTVLEDGCILGEGSIVTSHTMVRDRFILREVRIGRGATVGVGCIVMPGVCVGPGAVVLPGSVLRTNTHVPEGETWGGAPAICIRDAPQ
jgi:acetyltransferase-like isoleucine patch superfamily enzyme